MAFTNMGSVTEHSSDSQENMFEGGFETDLDSADFESAAEFPGHDLVELPEPSAEHEPELAQYRDVEESTPALDEDDFEEAEPESAELIVTQGESASSPIYPNPDPDPAPEPSPTPDPEPHPDEPNLPLTIADFVALEDRVLLAVSLVRRERQARSAAEERAGFQEGRAAAAESRAVSLEAELLELKAHAPAIEQLQQEVDTLRQEREQVRQRVERLLGQLDALEL